MTDLRALLHEPWCPKCRAPHEHCCDGGVDALATRLPECVPPWLECGRVKGFEGWYLEGRRFRDEQAELLFIAQAVKLLVKEKSYCHVHRSNYVMPGDGKGDSLPAALAAALHRLADEKETKL